MKGNRSRGKYRIYIVEDRRRHYLRTWTTWGKFEHLIFDVDARYAMKFRDFATAMDYRDRMIKMNYKPHIEGI